jgi:signal transduction histidine kinase
MAGADTAHEDPPPAGLAARLFIAQVLVVIAGAVTLWVVAEIVGPPVFRSHLDGAGVALSRDASAQVQDAFASASTIAVTLAVLAALLAALAVSAYISQRIAGAVRDLAGAARLVAEGRYDARVPSPRMGAEFGMLADSFNVMAGRLDSIETTRRRILSDLAHEMRTPVATIEAYVEGLEDGLASLDAETAAVLRAQTSRLTRLAEDLGAVSRAEEQVDDLQRHVVAPADLAATAVAAAADAYAAKGVDLVVDLSGALPPVDVDPDRIGQVLANLLNNALRHTPHGGAVAVRLVQPDPGRLEIAVADTGEGIDAEHLPHVFERFYRADDARDQAHGGSGIGLSIAKAFVEAHGGSIGVSSPGLGGGTTFAVSLPTAVRPPRPPQSGSAG